MDYSLDSSHVEDDPSNPGFGKINKNGLDYLTKLASQSQSQPMPGFKDLLGDVAQNNINNSSVVGADIKKGLIGRVAGSLF